MAILKTEERISEHKKISKLGKPFVWKRKKVIYHIQCDVCERKVTRTKGDAWNILKHKRHACSPECIGKLGRKPGYKPRRARRKNGYIYLGRRREHCIVAEKMLGRLLAKGEIVHHVNGDKGDNLEENLVVCGSTAEHNRIHGQLEGLAFLLVQQGQIAFCKSCKLYFTADLTCGCAQSFSV